MGKIRIIPRLDIKGQNLVKGIHLEGLRVIGDPQLYAEKYYADGADEILYVDIVASLYNRNNIVEVIKKTAKNISIPLIVAGGIRSLEDIRNILRVGADKVAINTQAIKNPLFVRKAAKEFGSQCIVVAIDIKRWPDRSFLSKTNETVTRTGVYEPSGWTTFFQVYTENGRQQTGLDAFEWALQAVEMGAGELMITSIDKEGTLKGYEEEFIGHISTSVPVPVIAGGGAGKLEDIKNIILNGKCDAVTIASLLHYDKTTITEIKNYLTAQKIQISSHG